jgi:hypothetical protein
MEIKTNLCTTWSKMDVDEILLNTTNDTRKTYNQSSYTLHKPCLWIEIQLTLIDDENTMKDDGQSDLVQNVPFKEPWFTTLWLNGQFKYQMLYEDITMWACVATSNLQSYIMTSITMHQKN